MSSPAVSGTERVSPTQQWVQINLCSIATEQPDQVDQMLCVVCGAIAAKVCGGCKTAPYCSKDCQKEDRKLHKSICPWVKADDFKKVPRAGFRRVFLLNCYRNKAELVTMRVVKDEAGESLDMNQKIIDLQAFYRRANLHPDSASASSKDRFVNCSPGFGDQIIGHAIVTHYPDVDPDMSHVNLTIDALFPGNLRAWTGPVIIYTCKTSNGKVVITDVGPRDVLIAATEMVTARDNPVTIFPNPISALKPDQNELRPFVDIPAIKIVWNKFPEEVYTPVIAPRPTSIKIKGENITVPGRADIPCTIAHYLGLSWYLRPLTATTSSREVSEDLRWLVHTTATVPFDNEEGWALDYGGIDFVGGCGGTLIVHGMGSVIRVEHIAALNYYMDWCVSRRKEPTENQFRLVCAQWKYWASITGRGVFRDVECPYNLEQGEDILAINNPMMVAGLETTRERLRKIFSDWLFLDMLHGAGRWSEPAASMALALEGN